jgi:Xaa-Pro aminopeptidase
MSKRTLTAMPRRRVLHERAAPLADRSAASPASFPEPEHTEIMLGEYMQRRERVLKSLGKSAALVFAGTEGGEHFAVNPFFFHLTGIANESGAAILFDPTSDDPRKRVILFLRPLNPEADRWDGLREHLSGSLRTRLGFRTVLRTTQLPMWLAHAARRAKSLACLHPFAQHTQNVTEDLATYRKVAERMVGVQIEDRTDLLPRMRAGKSRAEISLIKHAIDITHEGFLAAMRTLAPDVGEGAIQRALEQTYAERGGQGLAFGSIVGSGLNATVLHYRANSGPTNAGELVVIDSGAKFGGYCADITRTLPVNGRFSRQQRAIYDVVLMAQEAAIAACRPGASLWEIDAAARSVIEHADLGDFFIHGIGHHLGLEVHDIDPRTPLEPGAVVTIEPGVYIPDQKLGIRIEDDVLITSRGRQVLSEAIPKTAGEIERVMGER